MPIEAAELEVHEPFVWDAPFNNATRRWTELLDGLEALREEDAPADGTLYYGLIIPNRPIEEFCEISCILGIASVRSQTGFGIVSPDVGNTFAHEIGHLLNRRHSPCGSPSRTEPAYPYPGGTIGVHAYHPLEDQIFAPEEAFDFMGYCSPNSTSDFTYLALLESLDVIYGSGFSLQPRGRQQTLYIADGELLLGSVVTAPRFAGDLAVTYEDGRGGREVVWAATSKIQDLDAVRVQVPLPSIEATRIMVDGYSALDLR